MHLAHGPRNQDADGMLHMESFLLGAACTLRAKWVRKSRIRTLTRCMAAHLDGGVRDLHVSGRWAPAQARPASGPRTAGCDALPGSGAPREPPTSSSTLPTCTPARRRTCARLYSCSQPATAHFQWLPQ